MIDISEALTCHSNGDLKKAKELYLEFLKDNPKQPDVSNLVGIIFLQEKDYKKAQIYFEDAVEGFPCAEFYQNLGLSFFNQKQYEKAMSAFLQAAYFEPDNIDFIRNFAKMAKQTEQYKQAEIFYKRVVELDKNDFVAWNNLGLVYEKLHKFVDAQNAYKKSLDIEKNFEALHNLGVLFRTLRDFDNSIKFLHEALEMRQDNRETKISLGMSYLSKKDLKNGYKYYQYMNPELKSKYKNYWDGKKHCGKTLFLDYYAGYGDHIMFSRYFRLVKDYFEHVKVLVPMSERELFVRNFPEMDFVDKREQEYDYSANIMDLQNLLNIDFNNIPYAQGYLNADEKLIFDYYQKYFSKSKKYKVGLFWQGNPKVFTNRSIKLKELEKLFKINNIDFFSFEKDDEMNQIQDYPFIVDLGCTFKNFSYTAAALKNIDCLITVDSSVLHLAGALGVKTILLLPYSSEWRWFKDNKKTCWYDSVRIFKQTEPYVWNDVVDRVFNELHKFSIKPLDS